MIELLLMNSFTYIKNNFYNEINIKNIMNIHFDKDGKKITIQAQPEEMLSEIVIKYLKKLGKYDLKPIFYYYYNSKLLNLFGTINENQIMNNSIIFVTENPNYFMGNNQFNYIPKENFYNANAMNQSRPNINMGMMNMICEAPSPNLNANYGNFVNIMFIIAERNIMIQGSSNTKFCELVDKLRTKANLHYTDKPIFIFNSIQIMADDQRTISELKLRDQSRIEVILHNDVLGAPRFPNINNGNCLKIIFELNYRDIIVQGTPTTKFCELVYRFETKVACFQPNKFIFKSQEIFPNDQRTISELKLQDQSRISVISKKDVIGAGRPVNDEENKLEFNNNSPEIYQNKNLNTLNYHYNI